MSAHDHRARVTAVLGPTNTGKTYLAIERMLGHRSGMIGFPLRLLARENYDRIVKIKGAKQTALVTGEERIIPPGARYFVCTVESMPVERPVEFLAIDEIQLAADPERGHIFADRLLRARGLSETMVLGAETIKPLLRQLLPNVEFVSRPRFSSLAYVEPKKLVRLPRRSAVVAFSAADVYAIAELMRRAHGGCAVVLGALSPRARNAQVALYQAGEVDYMVATDAIGMGLNMDLDHVAFARLSKFDGKAPRRLTAPEMAQIAGRAGRHMRDGSFSTTAEQGALDGDLVEAIETHRFDPLTHLYWRNPDLDFRTLGSLLKSLDSAPPSRLLRRKGDADDHQALSALARNDAVTSRATSQAAIRLLWEVCQIPDFRKTMAESHGRLLAQIFQHLSEPKGRLPTDWVAAQIDRLDRADGDIDQLSQRLAHIRTWTYVSHREDWLVDTAHWQERTRAIEDKLSDALHEKLTQRFVDRRGAMLVQRLKSSAELLAGVRRDGTVIVEGHAVGHLDGLVFKPDAEVEGEQARQLLSAARRALAPEMEARVKAIAGSPDEEFSLSDAGKLSWRKSAIGRLVAGPQRLAPGIEAVRAEFLEPAAREQVRQRLASFMRAHAEATLAPLFALDRAELTGAARGLAFQLVEGLGSIERASVQPQLAALGDTDREALTKLGVRFGTDAIYLATLLGRKPARLRALLHAVHMSLHPIPVLPKGKAIARLDTLPIDWYRAAGLRVLGPRAIRIDQAEALAQAARRLARKGEFGAEPGLLELAGCAPAELGAVLAALGYREKQGEAGPVFSAPKRKREATQVARAALPDSPFATLRARLAAS
jgi:ATP-dependent RNA helicase SUPV3L1/SUV3